jgi:co-chaperonin GroES (HSP10)
MMRLPEIVSRSETIRPLRDKILVKPLDWEPSKVLEVVRHGRPLRGEVIAVGPGSYPKRYNRDYSKTWDSKQFVPLQVKPGDVVELGGLNQFDGEGYGHFTEVMHGTERLLICQESDICGVVDEAASESGVCE